MRTRQHAIVAYVMAILGALAVSVLAASAAQDPQPPPAAAGGRVRPDARQGQARPGQQADRLEIAELQRLFDAYTVMQAQDALQLDDAQFGQFLPKLKALQDTRRRNEIARSQAVAELARMTAPGAAGFDEAAVKEKMRALVDLEGRAAAELRRAYETIDQQLDVRRQARFRVFEQNMERRKLQLMLRARRGSGGLGG
jgi:hypothetical protein